MSDLALSHMLVNKETRQIVAVGYFPTPPEDNNLAVVETDAEDRALLDEPGTKILTEDGHVQLIKSEPIARVEQPDYGTYGDADNTTIIQVVTGLTQFLTMGDPTPKETARAVKHIARAVLYILKRTVRLS